MQKTKEQVLSLRNFTMLEADGFLRLKISLKNVRLNKPKQLLIDDTNKIEILDRNNSDKYFESNNNASDEIN